MVILFMIESQGAPEERSARRELELLLLLSGSRKGAVQLWKYLYLYLYLEVGAQAAHLRQRPAGSGQASHRG